METVLLVLLAVQGVLGGIDTLFNHELVEHLPRRIEARTEVALHACRELLYGLLFIGLASFAWLGSWAIVPLAVLGVQLLVDAADEYVENKTRVLPQNERVLHYFIIINLGLLFATLVFVCRDWFSQTSDLAPREMSALSLAVGALGLAALAWSLRDLLAWMRLGQRVA